MFTQRCIVIAHRGASRVARENTRDAFVRARALGADMVELDARRTRDGVVVVHHDATLRDDDAGAPVALVALDRASLPAHVPTLADALDACAGMHVNVEIKNGAGEPDHDPHGAHLDAILAVLDDAIARGRDACELLVSSFDRDTLVRVRARAPHLPTALLTFALDDPDEVLAHVREHGHVALHPFDSTVDAALVRRAHDAGLRVHVWTVDDPARLRSLVEMGVDGLCTNEPDVGRAVVDAALGGAGGR